MVNILNYLILYYHLSKLNTKILNHNIPESLSSMNEFTYLEYF